MGGKPCACDGQRGRRRSVRRARRKRFLCGTCRTPSRTAVRRKQPFRRAREGARQRRTAARADAPRQGVFGKISKQHVRQDGNVADPENASRRVYLSRVRTRNFQREIFRTRGGNENSPRRHAPLSEPRRGTRGRRLSHPRAHGARDRRGMPDPRSAGADRFYHPARILVRRLSFKRAGNVSGTEKRRGARLFRLRVMRDRRRSAREKTPENHPKNKCRALGIFDRRKRHALFFGRAPVGHAGKRNARPRARPVRRPRRRRHDSGRKLRRTTEKRRLFLFARLRRG